MKGGLRATQLPQTIELASIREGIFELWRRGQESNVEVGACLIGSDSAMELAHVTTGTRTGVRPGCRRAEHVGLLGFVHTHPPEIGSDMTYPGFSPGDYVKLLRDGDGMAMVCNGMDVFVLVRTRETVKYSSEIEPEVTSYWKRLTHMPEHGVDEWMSFGFGDVESAIWRANRLACARLNLGFYAGRRDENPILVYGF